VGANTVERTEGLPLNHHHLGLSVTLSTQAPSPCPCRLQKQCCRDCDMHDTCVQWIDNGNVRSVLRPRAGSAHPETVELHPVLQCPGATVVVKHKRAEHERLLPGDLGVEQLPLADPHAPVPAQVLRTAPLRSQSRCLSAA
jgi:hypothetical protein